MSGRKSRTIVGWLIAVTFASALSLSPALAAGGQTQNGAGEQALSQEMAPASTSVTAEPAAQPLPAKKTMGQKVKAALRKINPMRLVRDREFKQASALFPAFCKDWQRKLHDREVNNQQHIAWQLKEGYQTGIYVAYGPVNYCEAHQSAQGFAIGKLKYEEMKYYLVGKTPDEAGHAKPQITEMTETTELFRWDKGKWFY